GVPWMVTAIGRQNFPMMAVTLALGGHIRTGLEDVVYVGPGVFAESNAQLVTRARALCDAIGRPVATPAQAREILGVG
ncbi:MAG TPA: 3-keto-5-aminohexanoate cleavage protein, partial [Solirubrobacteraceae bacterium]